MFAILNIWYNVQHCGAFRNPWSNLYYCFWTWMMSFFYSANGVIFPIFVREVFGQKKFVFNVIILWLSYPVGSILITILMKALFETINFSGFAVCIAFCHVISLYTAHSMKTAHKNYLLKQVEEIDNDAIGDSSHNVSIRSDSASEPSTQPEDPDLFESEKEQQIRNYNLLKTVLSL